MTDRFDRRRSEYYGGWREQPPQHPLDRHLHSLGADVQRAYDTDPATRASLTMMRTVITQVQMAMREAGCARGQIEQVVSALCYGAVSPGEMYRVQLQREIDLEQTERLMYQPIQPIQFPQPQPRKDPPE